MEKSGLLIDRVMEVFNGITGANMNPELQKVQDAIAPKVAAMQDAIHLNPKLFARVEKIYNDRHSLNLDAESLRLVEYDYQEFVLAGARLPDTDKAELKKLNEEEANLTTAFISKLLAATKDAAYVTKDKSALAGLSDAQIAAAAAAAKERKVEGWVLPLQNTTQQPELQSLTNRSNAKGGLRKFVDSGGARRRERHTRRSSLVLRRITRARKANLLGYPELRFVETSPIRWPRSPGSGAQQFMDAMVPASTAKAVGEGKDDIQDLIDAQKKVDSNWSLGIGSSIPSKCARRSTISMSRRSSHILS